ncbi:unnamed protein product [Ilex paraguariensis]|uniref:RNA polymerase alpha subunit domain-containing protein n=1 Tax=Ilex paraguariensis TaxID=185542 RepID=A0ABC8RWL1_9AQUA
MRGRSWSLYDDWVLIYGKYRATGEFAQGLEEMIKDNSVVGDIPGDANVEAHPTGRIDDVNHSQRVTQGREVQIAIPIIMARLLTYPEHVSHHNIEKLRQCVRNGANKYPGARFLKKSDGTSMLSSKYSKMLHGKLAASATLLGWGAYCKAEEGSD